MSQGFNRNGHALSRIGLGASRIGSFNNPQPLSQARALIAAAIEMGVTLIDTSNIYGQGDSETQIGQAIAGRREQAFVVTKTGKGFSAKMQLLRPLKPLLRPLLAAKSAGGGAAASASAVTARREGAMRQNWAPKAFGPSLDRSLRRLKTDYVDGFLLHSPPAPVAGDAEVGAALASLQRAGKVRHYGVSCDDIDCFRSSLTMPGLTLLQLPWDVIVAIDPADAGTLRDRGISVLAREVIRQQPGLAPTDATVRAAAHPLVDTVLIGTRSTKHLRAIVDALG
jgi:aryl-alcohol dehydrogenase-like predicted oxidoreductase